MRVRQVDISDVVCGVVIAYLAVGPFTALEPNLLSWTAYIRGVTAPFSWQLPYGWPRKPVLARNVVATSQPLAAQAGLQVMADGGNAVDAIVATAVTLTIVEPVSNGIGSDAFAIVWDGRQLHGLNASGRSPAAWTPEYFSGDAVPPLGWDSVTVPGAVSAWVALHGKFGRLPFAKLFESAIHYGRNGFLVSPTIAAQWAAQVPLFASQPGFADAFLRNGRAPMPGELFTLPRARRDAGKDRRDQRRGVLPRRTRGSNGGACASQRRRHAR